MIEIVQVDHTPFTAANEVLAESEDAYHEVLVIGELEDGVFLHSSFTNAKDILWLLKVAERSLMKEFEEDYD